MQGLSAGHSRWGDACAGSATSAPAMKAHSGRSEFDTGSSLSMRVDLQTGELASFTIGETGHAWWSGNIRAARLSRAPNGAAPQRASNTLEQGGVIAASPSEVHADGDAAIPPPCS